MKVAVIGAGIWGACSAYHLKKEGADVELYDMWGPGNARSGSGGASRIIRLTYGNDKIYTELTNKSFAFWEELSNKSERELYNENGMLWLVSQNDSSYVTDSSKHIQNCGHTLEEISIEKAKNIYPNINFEDINQVFFEKKAGTLMASRCCKNVVREYQKNGGKIKIGEVKIDEENLNTKNSISFNGKTIDADKYIIACGPWNRICALPAIWVGLLYDDNSLLEAEKLASKFKFNEILSANDSSSRNGLKGNFGKYNISDLAKEVIAISCQGLKNRKKLDASGNDETSYLLPLIEMLNKGETLADEMIRQFNSNWDGSVNASFKDQII